MQDTKDLGIILNAKYRLDRLIGRGGMGVVYQGTHLELGCAVAVKTIHRSLAHDQTLVERLRREARLAGSLGHQHICEVQDVGVAEDGRPFLVMPLLEGVTLTTEMNRKDGMSMPRILGIVGQLLDALETAHLARIVHRDIKPDNVFLITQGDRQDFVKLLDFGIAKAVDEDNSLTATGHMPGTPAYMAPELLEGAAAIDGRTDLFSVGVLLYELILGTRPFRGMTFFEITNRIFDNDFDPPRKVDPHVPQLLENLIVIAMAHRPQDRFSSAAKMRAVLQNVTPVALHYKPKPIGKQPSDGRSPSPTLTDYVKDPLPRRRH